MKHSTIIYAVLIMIPLLSIGQAVITPAEQKLVSNGNHDLLIGDSDFEGTTFGDWSVEGDAFGIRPASQIDFKGKGFWGNGLASSMGNGAENSIGTLTSPEFTIERTFINFLISGGNWPKELRIKLMIDGKEMAFNTGNHHDNMLWMSWNVAEWRGERAKIIIEDNDDTTVDRSSFINPNVIENVQLPMAHINIDHIVQSDAQLQYTEKYRPQFHFSPQINWINDPNGLVYSDGKWHMFAQFDPYLLNTTGNQSWLHAESTDLLHWAEDPIVPEVLLNSYDLGQAYTGSGFVDHEDQLGLKATGANAPDVLVVYYLRTRKGLYYAYSDNNGKTWKDYPNNPVVDWPNSYDWKWKNRIDAPKVARFDNGLWFAPMFDDRLKPVTKDADPAIGTLAAGTGVTFIVSEDLKTWRQKQKIILETPEAECLEAFEMPVFDPNGNPLHKKQWVMNMGHDGYALANLNMDQKTDIDKRTIDFTFGEKQSTVVGSAYCPMTWYNAPNGRRIQMTWGNRWPGFDYPDMPFKSQMTFPISLGLVDYGAHGIQLTRTPVTEISELYTGTKTALTNVRLTPETTNPLSKIKGELFDIEMTVVPDGANTEFGIRLHSGDATYTIAYDTKTDHLKLQGLDSDSKAPKEGIYLPKPNASVAGAEIKLRILIDRSLIEAFAGDGRVYFIGTLFPPELEKSLELYTLGGAITIRSLTVNPLKSIYQ